MTTTAPTSSTSTSAPTGTELPAPLVILDLETDGLHPGRRIWEFAAIRRDPRWAADPTAPGQRFVDWTTTEHHGFVSIDLRNSDPQGLKIGGFWDRHPTGRKVAGRPTTPADVTSCVLSKHEAARDLMRITFGAHLIGVNPAFDADTLTGLLRAEGYLPSWHYHLLDLVAMTMGHLNAHALLGEEPPLLPPVRSDDLAAAVGVEPAHHTRHTALGDARWAARWFDRLTGHTTAPINTTAATELAARP